MTTQLTYDERKFVDGMRNASDEYNPFTKDEIAELVKIIDRLDRAYTALRTGVYPGDLQPAHADRGDVAAKCQLCGGVLVRGHFDVYRCDTCDSRYIDGKRVPDKWDGDDTGTEKSKRVKLSKAQIAVVRRTALRGYIDVDDPMLRIGRGSNLGKTIDALVKRGILIEASGSFRNYEFTELGKTVSAALKEAPSQSS